MQNISLNILKYSYDSYNKFLVKKRVSESQANFSLVISIRMIVVQNWCRNKPWTDSQRWVSTHDPRNDSIHSLKFSVAGDAGDAGDGR